jgi:hypothetical protein
MLAGPSRLSQLDEHDVLAMSEPGALDGWNAPREENASESVGGKAAGLLALPRAWVPRWVVVRSDRSEWQPARDACARVLQHAGRWVLVRSNGPRERSHPGEGRTFVAASGNLDQLLVAVATELARGQWPIVQAAIDPALLGVMSNERRVCRRPSQWLVEGAVDLRGPRALKIAAAESPVLDSSLNVESSDRLTRALAQVAGYLNTRFPYQRVRCEWAWDGRKVWVLQADPQPPSPPGDGDAWLERQSYPWTRPRRPARPVQGGWGKADSLRLFAQQGLPTLTTVCISPTQWKTGTAQHLLAAAGLHASVAHPLSVRTDSRRPDRSLLLPTSGACESPEALARFMTRAANDFAAAGTSERDWTFLIAPWVDARAAAWAHARPGGELVDIDAVWGHADGLLVLPHDSFAVSLDQRKVAEEVRHKPLLLRADTETRIYESLGSRWDWRASLTAPEALRAAEWCQQLADALGSETRLLILSAINGLHEANAMLPIIHLPFPIREPSGRRGAATATATATATISSAADARRLPAGTTAMELRLPADQLRNVDELREIAATARAARLPIVVPGSRLGHTLYILRTAGAQAFSAEQMRDDTIEWVTCLIAREQSLSRIIALTRARATQLARDSLRSAERIGSDSAIERARQAIARLEAIGAGAHAPKCVAELPVIGEPGTDGLNDLDNDALGQPLVRLA